MGMVSKILGIALSAVGMMMFTIGMTTGSDWLFLIVGFVTMVFGFSLLADRGPSTEVKPPPPTVTEIHCDSSDCEFKEIRDFTLGDYILKPLEVRCPKCESTMTIQGVYMVREEPEEKYNV